jgi:D-lactate dehydrogenase (cytochrome)
VRHFITTRVAGATALPRVDTDPSILGAFLNDAAHVPGGFATGLAIPHDINEVAAIVRSAAQILPIGAQSSLTGGATPRGDVILSTRALTRIDAPHDGLVRVGAGVPLAALQRQLATANLYFPPVPTFDGACVGGTIATNAAGAATFKYGSTRRWVQALTLVLASGDILEIARGQAYAGRDDDLLLKDSAGRATRIPMPRYAMPAVAKLSAGYFSMPGMDLVDLFIGSEGTLGIIVDATLRVIPRPRTAVALVSCADDAQAVAVTAMLRRDAEAAWNEQGQLDVAAIEYIDGRSLRRVPGDVFRRVNLTRPERDEAAILLVQFEVPENEDDAFVRFETTLAECGIRADPLIASPGDERTAAHLFDLRESVPASINALVASFKMHDPAIEKTAGDMVVPFDRLAKSIAIYRAAFERRGLDYAIWGHASDGNLHPNVIPRTFEDVTRGREALLDIGREVIGMGGAPLAEHGVGRSVLKQRLLYELYGEDGIGQMRAIKRALDPKWKLSSGVLFPADEPR